ncbi:hypothetical protein M942_13315 [Enterobacter ludwigii]|nr:hypothetical protein M942_13315 [Enterobacter ludwigii]
MTILITGVLHDKKELVAALTRMTITMKKQGSGKRHHRGWRCSFRLNRSAQDEGKNCTAIN